MDRYQQLFTKQKKQKKIALVPFVTIGDPNWEQSLKIVKMLIDSGADALELGIAFSDPIADGPTIQRANNRALQAGINTEKCWQFISLLRQFNNEIPIGLLVYSNLIIAAKLNNFYKQAKTAGVDSILVVDVPLCQASAFQQQAVQNDIAPIYIIPPNYDVQNIKLLASLGRGYSYVMSRSGVTGLTGEQAMPTMQFIQSIIASKCPPPMIGFGISTGKQIQAIANIGAAGAIVGSHLVNIIEDNLQQPQLMLNKVQQKIAELQQNTFYK